MTETTPVVDIDDPAYIDHPAECLAAVRAQAAVCPTNRGWLMVTHDDVARQVLTDPGTFSSRINKHSPPPADIADEVASIRAQGWPYTNALGTSDAPAHTRHRQLVNRSFTPRSLAAMEPAVRAAAEELADSLRYGEEIDILADFAEPLPVWAISSVLGLPHSRRADIRRWSTAAVSSIGAVPDSETFLRYERDLLDFQQTIAGIIESATPETPGLIAELAINLRAEGSEDSVLELPLLLTLLRELVVAGNETTGKFMSEALRLFGADPQNWQRVREDPSYADVLVEESLRLATPTQAVMRIATVDTELGGVTVPAGTQLMVSLASANRDESAWEVGEEFDADRANVRQHLGFGLGAHTCIGAGLARMESRIAIQVLAQRVERITMAERPQAILRSYVLRGPLEMWGTITPLSGGVS
jgi:cytochrome P450